MSIKSKSLQRLSSATYRKNWDRIFCAGFKSKLFTGKTIKRQKPKPVRINITTNKDGYFEQTA